MTQDAVIFPQWKVLWNTPLLPIDFYYQIKPDAAII